jgi:anthranilate phosphoribosyltransferase
VRTQLGIPTVFNFLGPLSHPARVQRQVIGLSDQRIAPIVVGVLQQRGAPRAIVVSGDDGMDEFTTTSTSTVHELRDGLVTTSTFDPQDVGIQRVSPEAVAGGSPEENAAIARRVFAGESGPHRDIVCLNAAAGLFVAGVVDDIASGVVRAQAALDSGAAAGVLERLVIAANDATN